jgi:hypothetical protein
MVLTQTVDADPTSAVRAGVRWYEVRSVSSTPTLFQSGTYSPNSDDRWMPSIAMNKAGDIAIGYSVSSSSVYPSIRWTGRTAADPAGVMTVAETSITAGSGSQTGYDRWGDYSALTVDPVDDCTFWYTNEYYPSSSSYGWHTRVGWFRVSDCGTTTPPTSPPATPTGVTATGQGGTSAGTIAVSWSPVTGATSYTVTRLQGTTSTTVATTSSTSLVDTGLQAVTQYGYQVVASNSAGSSAPSSTASAYTSPTQLTAKAVSRSEIDLTWNGGSAATYTVYRSSGGGAFTVVASGMTTAAYKSTGLARNTSYSYYVTATVSGTTTAQSNTATAKTLKH